MTNPFKNATELSEAVLKDWPTIIGFLQGAKGPGGEKFNQEAVIPATEFELWWFDERVLAAGNLVKSLGETGKDWGVAVPISFIGKLDSAATKLRTHIGNIANDVLQIEEKGVTSLDPTTWEIVVGETNANINFASHLQSLKGLVETLLQTFYQIAPITGATKFEAFSEAVRELSEKAEQVRSDAREIEETKEAADTHLSEIRSRAEQSANAHGKISEILKSAQSELSKISGADQTAQIHLTSITEISNSANELKGQVDAYAEDFEAFQLELDEKNNSYQTLSQNTQELFASLEKRNRDIESTIGRADEMLQGATNAGLAGTFDTTRHDIGEQLKWARRGFYGSIALLFVSAIPLAVYLAMATMAMGDPASLDAMGSSSRLTGSLGITLRGGGLNPGTTAALALLMIPTVWLTKFSAARHHQLFLLHEHYQYKYSLAMAVEGFKKQAPDHADAIAAETFNRLLFNPADRLDGKDASDDHPSPLMNWLMNKFGFNAQGREQ